MSAKHIPGPWLVFKPGEGGNEGPNLEVHDPYGRTATVYGELDSENYATANLIAAAPELLAALSAAFDELCAENKNQDLIDNIDFALQKAKGGA